MTKLCPISSKVLTCNSSCAWYCEDVSACAVWKTAEGFTIMTAFVNEIIEKSQKVAQEAIEKCEDLCEEVCQEEKEDGEERQQKLQ